MNLKHAPSPVQAGPVRHGGPAVDLAVGGLALAAAAGLVWWLWAPEAAALWGGAGLYLLMALLVGGFAPVSASAAGSGLGAANRVTLLRAWMTCVIAMVALGALPSDSAQWTLIVLATIALSLDGVDGAIARRRGIASRFGARFDMETDALLVLVLATAVWLSGQVGAWVLLIGAMRYAFVAAGLLRASLRAPLPPSLARRVVCVVQGVALCVALGPIIPRWLASIAVGIALAMLLWSFGRDVWWLLRTDQGSTRSNRPSASSISR